MALSTSSNQKIKNLLVKTVKDKLIEYQRETNYMPFHTKLFGEGRSSIFSMYSFIQSMNTTFGMSIWEQIAVILAIDSGYHAERQYKLFGEIDDVTEKNIRIIMYKYQIEKLAVDKNIEIESIRSTIKNGLQKPDPNSTVDLFIIKDGVENYFDITSVKPNMKEFNAMKIKLLRWTALRLSQNKNINIFTRLAIPYNPYYPGPYNRWTLKGLYDLNKGEILIQQEFWNFVAGKDVYDDLLNTFEDAGEILKNDLDDYFIKFNM
jgi:hypothetical protein